VGEERTWLAPKVGIEMKWDDRKWKSENRKWAGGGYRRYDLK
jgi:hypothetical protein